MTIPCEISNSYLQQRRTEKLRKYERLLQPRELKQVECAEGEIVPMVIGTLGTMNDETLDGFKKLKLQTQRNALQMTVATGSVNILNAHFKREDFTT